MQLVTELLLTVEPVVVEFEFLGVATSYACPRRELTWTLTATKLPQGALHLAQLVATLLQIRKVRGDAFRALQSVQVFDLTAVLRKTLQPVSSALALAVWRLKALASQIYLKELRLSLETLQMSSVVCCSLEHPGVVCQAHSVASPVGSGLGEGLRHGQMCARCPVSRSREILVCTALPEARLQPSLRIDVGTCEKTMAAAAASWSVQERWPVDSVFL